MSINYWANSITIIIIRIAKFKIVMLKISIVFLATILNALTQSLPCPNNCLTCSSSTSCLTCASQYYPSSASGTLTCLACP